MIYRPAFVDADNTAQLLQAVRAEATWEQPRIRVFGREYITPRFVAWHADPGCTYRYSGQQQPWRPWVPALQKVRELVEKEYGPQHGVLANLYENGTHSMSAHADDESDLEPGASVVMVSLGATRRFVLKHRTTKARHVLEIEDGSLLVMAGRTNTVAVHSVPKTAKPVGPRISLTFRRMANRGRSMPEP